MLILEIALGIVLGVVLLNFLPITLPVLAIGGILYLGFWAAVIIFSLIGQLSPDMISALFLVGVIGALAYAFLNQNQE